MSPEVTGFVVGLVNMAVVFAFVWLAEIRATRYERKRFGRAMLKMIERRLGDDHEYRAALSKLLHAVEHERGHRLPPSRGSRDGDGVDEY